MTITIQLTKNYGNKAIYPVCETAKIFTRLTGKKTLSRRDLDHIKSLGYTILIQEQTL